MCDCEWWKAACFTCACFQGNWNEILHKPSRVLQREAALQTKNSRKCINMKQPLANMHYRCAMTRSGSRQTAAADANINWWYRFVARHHHITKIRNKLLFLRVFNFGVRVDRSFARPLHVSVVIFNFYYLLRCLFSLNIVDCEFNLVFFSFRF